MQQLGRLSKLHVCLTRANGPYPSSESSNVGSARLNGVSLRPSQQAGRGGSIDHPVGLGGGSKERCSIDQLICSKTGAPGAGFSPISWSQMSPASGGNNGSCSSRSKQHTLVVLGHHRDAAAIHRARAWIFTVLTHRDGSVSILNRPDHHG